MPPAAAIASEGTTVAPSSDEVGCTTTARTDSATETTIGATEKTRKKVLKRRRKK